MGCVDSGKLGVVEQFGKYQRTLLPGINCLMWPVEVMATTVSTRLMELNVECETKTEDDVFVNCVISVQYKVIPEKVRDATYKLSNTHSQIRAYVFDVVRSTLPRMTLDAAFEAKEEISQQVRSQLSNAMEEYGFVIENALVTDINPDAKVKHAMNEINANKRLKEAALERAEAEKILVVKTAEAHAESQYLSGVGVANQRKAIIDGLKDSVNEFTQDLDGTGPQEVINLLMVTQYFDMLDQIGTKSKQQTIFVKHSPSAVLDLQAQLKNGLSGGMAK